MSQFGCSSFYVHVWDKMRGYAWRKASCVGLCMLDQNRATLGVVSDLGLHGHVGFNCWGKWDVRKTLHVVCKLPQWAVEIEPAFRNVKWTKHQTCPSSDYNLDSLEKWNYQAFRGRMGKNVKHESCRVGFFLEGSAVRFLKWGSNGLRFHEKPWLVRLGPVHTISHVQRKTDK